MPMAHEGRHRVRYIRLMMMFYLLAWQPALGFVAAPASSVMQRYPSNGLGVARQSLRCSRLQHEGRSHRLTRRRTPATQLSCHHDASSIPENRQPRRRSSLGALFAWTSARAPPFRRKSNFPAGGGSRMVSASSKTV
ncbi:unnamed protein product, partial [Laminaria digitata]